MEKSATLSAKYQTRFRRVDSEIESPEGKENDQAMFKNASSSVFQPSKFDSAETFSEFETEANGSENEKESKSKEILSAEKQSTGTFEFLESEMGSFDEFNEVYDKRLADLKSEKDKKIRVSCERRKLSLVFIENQFHSDLEILCSQLHEDKNDYKKKLESELLAKMKILENEFLLYQKDLKRLISECEKKLGAVNDDSLFDKTPIMIKLPKKTTLPPKKPLEIVKFPPVTVYPSSRKERLERRDKIDAISTRSTRKDLVSPGPSKSIVNKIPVRVSQGLLYFNDDVYDVGDSVKLSIKKSSADSQELYGTLMTITHSEFWILDKDKGKSKFYVSYLRKGKLVLSKE